MSEDIPRYWLPSGTLTQAHPYGLDDTCVVPEWAYEKLRAELAALKAGRGNKLYTATAGIEALKGAEHCAECSTITARLDGDNYAKRCCHCGAKLHGSYVSADELRALLAQSESEGGKS